MFCHLVPPLGCRGGGGGTWYYSGFVNAVQLRKQAVQDHVIAAVNIVYQVAMGSAPDVKKIANNPFMSQFKVKVLSGFRVQAGPDGNTTLIGDEAMQHTIEEMTERANANLPVDYNKLGLVHLISYRHQ